MQKKKLISVNINISYIVKLDVYTLEITDVAFSRRSFSLRGNI